MEARSIAPSFHLALRVWSQRPADQCSSR